jgi:hypothetical protein
MPVGPVDGTTGSAKNNYITRPHVAHQYAMPAAFKKMLFFKHRRGGKLVEKKQSVVGN